MGISTNKNKNGAFPATTVCVKKLYSSRGQWKYHFLTQKVVEMPHYYWLKNVKSEK